MFDHTTMSRLLVALCALSLFTFGCDDDDDGGSSAEAGESAAGESAAGESAAGESAAGESAAGEEAAGESAAGEGAAGEVVGEGNLNELDEDGRVEFCNARFDFLTGFVADNGETFGAAIERSCLLAGLFEGMDQASCETVVTACMTEATMPPSRDDYVADCLADESFFTECVASTSDVLTCESDSISHSLNAFSMVDLSAFSCEQAGDFASLMQLFPLLQSIAPPEDLCAPEVSMCLEGDEVPEE